MGSQKALKGYVQWSWKSGSVLKHSGHVIMRTYDTKTLPDDVVYYEVIKRKLNRRLIYECR